MVYYNYLDEEVKDVMAYIKEELDTKSITLTNQTDTDAIQNNLYEQLVDDDRVTGNASGSYTMSTVKAEEYLVTNWELLSEAINALDPEFNMLKQGAEACDIIIRIYLLPEAINIALQKLS